jgi:excisionase family DNA binding protein
MSTDSSIPVRALYDVPEAMALLNLSRTQLYELIRSRRLVTVTQGRRRLVPAASISAYVELRHASTNVTEKVYRKELRPVLTRGATAMDALFGGRRAGRSD